MPLQTITKTKAWEWVTSSGIWDVAKWASWTEFKALATSVNRSWRVVYWAAWHWGLLMELYDELKKAQHEVYITQADLVQNEETGEWIFPPNGTEWARSERSRGLPTRHAQVSKFWLEYKMKNFPE